MKINNVAIYILFAVCILLLVNSTFQNCELKKEQQKLQSLQLAYRDSIKAQIDRISASRRDTLDAINNYQKTIKREVDKKKDEISNINDIDSLIRLYYSLRPVDKTDK